MFGSTDMPIRPLPMTPDWPDAGTTARSPYSCALLALTSRHQIWAGLQVQVAPRRLRRSGDPRGRPWSSGVVLSTVPAATMSTYICSHETASGESNVKALPSSDRS